VSYSEYNTTALLIYTWNGLVIPSRSPRCWPGCSLKLRPRSRGTGSRRFLPQWWGRRSRPRRRRAPRRSAGSACASTVCASLAIYACPVSLNTERTYLRVTCHRKLECSEKMRSGRKSMTSTKAHSKMLSGFLQGTRFAVNWGGTYMRALRPKAKTRRVIERRSMNQTLTVFQSLG
jgi:hypothetical protein